MLSHCSHFEIDNLCNILTQKEIIHRLRSFLFFSRRQSVNETPSSQSVQSFGVKQEVPRILNGSPGYFFLLRAVTFTSSFPTILTQEDFCGAYYVDIRIISSMESFFLSIIVFKILAENCYKHNFSPIKGNKSNKESSDNFDPCRLCRPYH